MYDPIFFVEIRFPDCPYLQRVDRSDFDFDCVLVTLNRFTGLQIFHGYDGWTVAFGTSDRHDRLRIDSGPTGLRWVRLGDSTWPQI